MSSSDTSLALSVSSLFLSSSSLSSSSSPSSSSSSSCVTFSASSSCASTLSSSSTVTSSTSFSSLCSLSTSSTSTQKADPNERFSDAELKARLREADLLHESKHEHDEREESKVLHRFLVSKGHVRILDFVNKLNVSVVDLPLSAGSKLDQTRTTPINKLLQSIDAIIDSTPPLTSRSRFGNPAFRTFLQSLHKKMPTLLEALLGKKATKDVVDNISPYLQQSFGDERRIDYGTGHELNFACFLYCLYSLGAVTEKDFSSLVLNVFWSYISVVRRLQTIYLLEPAGSRGVWGLDDFHFLPFVFGSSQLLNHKHMRPRSVRYTDILEVYSKEYMYLACIKFINEVKLTSFAEHSPLLSDITTAKTWTKVNTGLIKMYRDEVLGKFAVIQHFIFSSFLPADRDEENAQAMEEAHKKASEYKKEMPCCTTGLRIPSALGARRDDLLDLIEDRMPT
eukprot:TRINITY_DN1403_c0_g1_i1.p1 TRINITY_DN1403_c0_g1~~TRINITY_DN1403_c0_g1_i1.p1  ORF type:complete len:463 (-),score=116.50 TRINITY_DN1403_c0_g1_i1:223-1578(-)